MDFVRRHLSCCDHGRQPGARAERIPALRGHNLCGRHNGRRGNTARFTAGNASHNQIAHEKFKKRSIMGKMATISRINGMNVTDTGAVHFTEQTLTDEQKLQARKNISAAAEEQALKNMYNLGAYDTFTDNGDGTATITRKTGYLYLDGSADENYSVWGANKDGRFIFLKVVENYVAVDYHVKSHAVANVLVSSRFEQNNSSKKCISLAQTSEQAYSDFLFIKTMDSNLTSLELFRSYLSANPISVQYELQTPYTEDVILDQPILYANDAGSSNKANYLCGDNVGEGIEVNSPPSYYNQKKYGVPGNTLIMAEAKRLSVLNSPIYGSLGYGVLVTFCSRSNALSNPIQFILGDGGTGNYLMAVRAAEDDATWKNWGRVDLIFQNSTASTAAALRLSDSEQSPAAIDGGTWEKIGDVALTDSKNVSVWNKIG